MGSLSSTSGISLADLFLGSTLQMIQPPITPDNAPLAKLCNPAQAHSDARQLRAQQVSETHLHLRLDRCRMAATCYFKYYIYVCSSWVSYYEATLHFPSTFFQADAGASSKKHSLYSYLPTLPHLQINQIRSTELTHDLLTNFILYLWENPISRISY